MEIALRTAFMYLYTLGLVRLLGKRGMGELSPFDFVIIVSLGSAVGDPMFYADVPLLHGVIVVTVVVGLQRLVFRLTERSPAMEHLIESSPALLVEDGKIVQKTLDLEDLSERELFMYLRLEGVEQLGEVRLAYLEQNGRVSVYKADKSDGGRSVLPKTS